TGEGLGSRWSGTAGPALLGRRCGIPGLGWWRWGGVEPPVPEYRSAVTPAFRAPPDELRLPFPSSGGELLEAGLAVLLAADGGGEGFRVLDALPSELGREPGKALARAQLGLGGAGHGAS